MANANGGVIMKAEKYPEGNEAATHNNSAREKICHISQNRRNSLTVNTIKAGRQAFEWGIFQPQQNYLPASNRKGVQPISIRFRLYTLLFILIQNIYP